MTAARVAWTPEEDARLRALWADLSLSASAIGRLLARGKNSIVGRAHRLRLPPRPAVTPAVAARAARNRTAPAEAFRRHGGGGGGVVTPGAVAQPSRASARPPRAVAGAGACARPLPPASPLASHHAAARAGLSGCRWPLWGKRERPTHLYCGAPVSLRPDGAPRPYCAAHAALAFVQPETPA